MIRSVFLLSFVIFGVLSDQPKCKLSDKACTKIVVNALYKKLYAAEGNKLDPIYEEVIEGKNPSFNFNFKQSTVKGFKDCNVDSARLGLKENTFDAVLLCPGISWTGAYDIKGQIKSKNVEGNGDFSISTKLYRLTFHADISLTTENENKYMRMNEFNVVGEPVDDVIFDFKNLYNGNKDLADDFHKNASENSKEVFAVFQDSLLRAAFKQIVVDSNVLFKKEPINKLVEI